MATENTPNSDLDVQKNTEAKPEMAAVGKLKDNAKLGQITMVTPPSFFQNQNTSFCLINLSKRDKDAFADQLNKHMPEDDVTIYLWDDNNFSSLDPFGADYDPDYEDYLETWTPNQKGRDYTWLLNAARASTYVIMNMDYSSRPLMVWSGYILTLAKTYFINSNLEEAKAYDVLNRNRIDAIPFVFDKIRRNKDSR